MYHSRESRKFGIPYKEFQRIQSNIFVGHISTKIKYRSPCYFLASWFGDLLISRKPLTVVFDSFHKATRELQKHARTFRETVSSGSRSVTAKVKTCLTIVRPLVQAWDIHCRPMYIT